MCAVSPLSAGRIPDRPSRLLNHDRSKPLGVFDIDRLHVAVQFLLGTLLVVSLSRNPNPHTEWHTLDTRFPDFFVQLWVEADIFRTLCHVLKSARKVWVTSQCGD